MECHLSLLEQRKIDWAKNDQSFTSFEYKNPNKILKTLKAKISGRAMITVASKPWWGPVWFHNIRTPVVHVSVDI